MLKTKIVSKALSVWVASFLVGLYRAFVIMCMWNWFAVQSLHVPNISFLQMVGLIWLIGIIAGRIDTNEVRWKMLFTAVEFCVPENKKDELTYALEEHIGGTWYDCFTTVVSQIVGNTVTLILGSGLHMLID